MEDLEIRQTTLDDWERFGEGATAQSYYSKSDDSKMLKLFILPTGKMSSIMEKQISDSLLSLGLRVPEAYEVVQIDGNYGVIFERVRDKVSIARALSMDSGRVEELAAIFADQCRKLHSTECDTELFGSFPEMLKGFVLEGEFLSETQRATLLDLIEKTPIVTTCVHGDLHIANMLLSGTEATPYWIDLSEFGYGNPLFDLGTLYYVCVVEDDDEKADMITHCTCEVLHEFWRQFIPRYLQTDDEFEIQAFEQKLRPYAALTVAHYASFVGALPNFIEDLQALVGE